MTTSDFVIETHGLTRYFGSKKAVDSLTMRVPRGSVFADPTSRGVIATSLTLSAITMVLIWLIGRRYAFSLKWRVAWMALSIVANLFTLLAIWLTTDFPAREICPSCGNPRVVNRERCEHCEAAFDSPQPDGTEVFA